MTEAKKHLHLLPDLHYFLSEVQLSLLQLAMSFQQWPGVLPTQDLHTLASLHTPVFDMLECIQSMLILTSMMRSLLMKP